MGILFALITAVCWGSIGLVSNKIGGTNQHQILGESYGILIFALLMFFIKQPTIDLKTTFVGLASGFFYCYGQNQQFRGFNEVGVSVGLPLSTAAQLIITTLAGAFIFHEWVNAHDYTFGFIALAVLIIGAYYTSKKEKGPSQEPVATKSPVVGYIAILLSGVGISLYSITTKAFAVDAFAILLPQAFGALIEAFAASSSLSGKQMRSRFTYFNVIVGLMWALGNLFYQLAIAQIGLAISFALSQMGIIISTLGGIFILHEHKTKKELRFTILGCVLVIAGGVLLGVMKA
ncbi:glucose uptake protein [Agrilactobacillus composti DSM 18527 = JCM 14202]|uniref:GRP family sugar transporter n=1 Tax=Agrilactobacillus composti TaxID=398555 RepID=UPI00042DEAC6|nr:GRP family sugar transporter [Agrilactobacillus composti]GAF38993.1 glucose uptake protein [Agrilactobacillus composti DSM 18527 = JCM 14202]